MKYQAYPEYKDSGVEWLGEVPSHWEVFRMDDLAETIKNQVSPNDLNSILVTHYSIPNVQSYGTGATEEGQTIDSSKFLVNEGDVLFSKLNPRKQTITTVSKHDHRVVASTEFVVLRPVLNDQSFINYLFHSQELNSFACARVESATKSHQRINPSIISKLKFFAASPEDRRKIANFLDQETQKIDNIIAKQQNLIELLKEKRQAVISHAVTKGINQNVKMKDSGVEWLGETPEHWSISQIVHCAFVTKLTGFEYTNLWRPSEDGEIIALRGYNIKERELDLAKVERISYNLSKKLKRSKLYKGDIVFPCTGTIGNAALIKHDDKFHINQNIAKICFDSTVMPDFAIYWLTSTFTRDLIDKNNMSGMQPVVLIGDIRKLPIPRLPIDEQVMITNYLDQKMDQFNKLIDRVECATKLLQERKTALISAAVTGKIDVRNA